MPATRAFHRHKPVILSCLVLVTYFVAGCTDIFQSERLVVDWSDWLKDGGSISWKLEPGTYKLDFTASGDGVTAEWLGGSCPKTQPMQELTMTCELSRDGQLIITNPSIFGLGANASTTVKVTRLR